MKKIFIAVVLIASLFLTSCNGRSSDSSTTLHVDMNEFMFSPDQFTVPAGKQIKLELKNTGSIKHDFIILKKGIEVQNSFNHEKQMDNIYFHAELESNNADTFTFTAPTEPGEYQVICGIPGHFQAGMTGKLTVVAP